MSAEHAVEVPQILRNMHIGTMSTTIGGREVCLNQALIDHVPVDMDHETYLRSLLAALGVTDLGDLREKLHRGLERGDWFGYVQLPDRHDLLLVTLTEYDLADTSRWTFELTGGLWERVLNPRKLIKP